MAFGIGILICSGLWLQTKRQWLLSGRNETDGALSELMDQMKGQSNMIWVCVNGENAYQLPLELFVAGSLAGSMDATYEIEALKAQAIVLRTGLLKKLYDQQKEGALTQDTDRICIWLEPGEYPYLGTRQLKRRWDKDYAAYYKRILTAVFETQGIYMQAEGCPITAPFHGMSVGKTRNLGELTNRQESYVSSVSCNEVLFAPDYKQTRYVRKELFDVPQECIRDQQGYIISVKVKGAYLSGEAFRQRLKMPSADLYWKATGKGYLITSYGTGHGFGFDEYYGNLLAQKGKSAMEILSYFFRQFTFSKV